MIVMLEWHPGKLLPRVGFIVTGLPMERDWPADGAELDGAVPDAAGHGRAAHRGRRARLPWTRLSCNRSRDNEVRLQPHARAHHLATFLRCGELPEAMADGSPTSLGPALIKIGAGIVRHARAVSCQLAEVAVTGTMVPAIPAAIRTQTDQKRQGRSVRHAGQRRCRAGMVRLCGPIHPNSSAPTTAVEAWRASHSIRRQDRAIGNRPLGAAFCCSARSAKLRPRGRSSGRRSWGCGMRAEILVGRERRRCWSVDDTSQIVREAFAPGARVALVARRRDVSRSQLCQ